MTSPKPRLERSYYFETPVSIAVGKLAKSPAAKTLESAEADEPAVDAASAEFIAHALRLGLPPDRWTITRDGGAEDDFLPPLVYFHHLGADSDARARAALAFSAAGCSLWHPWGRYYYVKQNRFDCPLDPKDVVDFILSGVDGPLRRVYLKLALADPLTSPDFASELVEAYQRAVSQSSKTSKGALGPSEERAKAVCSLLDACAQSIMAASSRPGKAWSALPGALADAQERLAAKTQDPQTLGPEALKRSASPELARRLRHLCLITARCHDDEALIVAALEASPGLKAQPNLACVPFAGPRSLFAQAMASGCLGPIDWLERAGANIWLASAQSGHADACAWAIGMLSKFPPGADLSPIARALLRGAWLDGHPEPQARCLALAKSAAELFCSKRSGREGTARAEADRVRAFLATMEKIAISESLSPPPASNSPRRAAL